MSWSYNFYDLSKIDLPHTELAAIIAGAAERANARDANARDCPWTAARGRKGRIKRLVWRTVFSKIREARSTLVDEVNAMMGRRIAA